MAAEATIATGNGKEEMEFRNKVTGADATHPSASELFVTDSLSTEECPGDTDKQEAEEGQGTSRHASPSVWQKKKTGTLSKSCILNMNSHLGEHWLLNHLGIFLLQR